MLSGSCHCGRVRIDVPQAPKELTNCNCSICRRLGGLWGYYHVGEVKFTGHPGNTDEYIQGDETLRLLRCSTCGCTTHWEPLDPESQGKMGVNMRNFDPEGLGRLRIRLLDGADTWESFYWEDIPSRRTIAPTGFAADNGQAGPPDGPRRTTPQELA